MILIILYVNFEDKPLFCRDDVYSGKSVTHVDIRFEQAAILYNIGALHSFLGAMDKRGSPEVNFRPNVMTSF